MLRKPVCFFVLKICLECLFGEIILAPFLTKIFSRKLQGNCIGVSKLSEANVCSVCLGCLGRLSVWFVWLRCLFGMSVWKLCFTTLMHCWPHEIGLQGRVKCTLIWLQKLRCFILDLPSVILDNWLFKSWFSDVVPIFVFLSKGFSSMVV